MDFVELQPPSGGCVLKLLILSVLNGIRMPAAFGRLCVETYEGLSVATEGIQPPSGGCVLKHLYRLLLTLNLIQPPSGGCVLKHPNRAVVPLGKGTQPPSGGCVLKQNVIVDIQPVRASRLRAAVC